MKIVCFGDSLTACGGEDGRFSDILQQRFPDHHFINRGVGGDTLLAARERFQQDVLDERPQVVLLELGANDWWQDERPWQAWAADLEYYVIRCLEHNAFPIILGVFGKYCTTDGQLTEKIVATDDRAKAFQLCEEDIAARHQCAYLPNIQMNIIGNRRCWADANHPNEYGNRYVADTIAPMLSCHFGTAALPIRLPNLETTRDFWREAMTLAPDRLAVVDGLRRFSYREADCLTERLSAALFAASGQPRPLVAAYMNNSLEYYLLYWAVQRMGGVIVPLNNWLKTESLQGIFSHVQPHLVCLREAESPLPAGINTGSTTVLEIPLLNMQGEGWQQWASLPAAPESPLTAEDLSIIMHTSGTTATPKGAMMRHSDLMFNVTAAINAHDFSANDIHLLVNPMFHCTALYSSLPAAACQKTPVIITSSTDADELLALVARERVTTMLSVPTIFQKILSLRQRERYDTSALRLIAYAGSPMPVATIHQLRSAFPETALHNFFGLTETISMTHVLRNDELEERPDSIGRLLPFVEAMVVNDNDCPLNDGTIGELLFAREEIIPGYYQQPQLLPQALTTIAGSCWFRTGDLASVDEEGYYYIKGRKKDMIIVGGENVFAAEVEAVIAAHPQVKEVAVKGVPATGVRVALGELVKAWVVANNENLCERDIKEFCNARLPSYKVPSFVVFLPTLPRNPSGKVVKELLED